MDRSQMWKLRIGLGLITCFVASGFMSFGELKYLIWGKTAAAQVEATYERIGGRRSGPRLGVEYRFQEEGGASRTEEDQVAIDSAIGEGDTVSIQYLPGEAGRSRIEGNRKIGAVVFFAACVVAGVLFILKLYLEAKAAYADPRDRRRKARAGR
jgi:hypothetical protein